MSNYYEDGGQALHERAVAILGNKADYTADEYIAAAQEAEAELYAPEAPKPAPAELDGDALHAAAEKLLAAVGKAGDYSAGDYLEACLAAQAEHATEARIPLRDKVPTEKGQEYWRRACADLSREGNHSPSQVDVFTRMVRLNGGRMDGFFAVKAVA